MRYTTKAPIRILHIVPSLSENSGVISVIMSYYRQIDRNKFQFDFIYHSDDINNYAAEINKLGGKIFKLPELRYSNLFKYCTELNEFFSENKNYQIIHGHVANTGIFYFFIAKIHKIPIRIIHSHNTMPSDELFKKIRNYFLQIPLNYLANNYCSCSEGAGKYLFGPKYMRSGKVQIIKNAIDLSKFQYSPDKRNEMREKLGLEDKIVIGHVGRFCNQKNHAFLIEVFNEIQKNMPNSKLLLIGDGPLLDNIRKKTMRLNLLEKVHFLGIRSDVNDLMQAMDYFVFPSLFEGLGIVLIEAQCSGLKCIVSNTIPNEAIITNLVKIMNLKDEPKVWADKIITDEKKYIRQPGPNILISSGYDIKSEVKRLEDFYINLLHHL